MKNIGLYFILLVSLAIINCGQADSGKKIVPAESFASISFKKDSSDLGTIEEKKIASYDFSFSNTGNSPLTISYAKGSCHCVQAKWPDKAINPGDSAIINVTFDPNGVNGYFVRTIDVHSNAKDSTVVLTLVGEVKQDNKKNNSSHSGKQGK